MEKLSVNEGKDEIAVLKSLAKREIERIMSLPQPVVRVCGPLTADGPDGYEKNAARLTKAEEILTARGMSVWNFDQAEDEIFGKGYDHDNIFKYFHQLVLESGLIKEAYFLPRSNESNGATLERNLALELGITVKEFREEWFGEG